MRRFESLAALFEALGPEVIGRRVRGAWEGMARR